MEYSYFTIYLPFVQIDGFLISLATFCIVALACYTLVYMKLYKIEKGVPVPEVSHVTGNGEPSRVIETLKLLEKGDSFLIKDPLDALRAVKVVTDFNRRKRLKGDKMSFTTRRLPKRQTRAPTSSISMNIAGTNTSDSTVENNRPPITASAIGERNSPPAPTASAEGIMPAIESAQREALSAFGWSRR